MNLKNKIAVVTGASSGLGAALSIALINKNAVVYGLARNEVRLQQLKDKCGPNFHPVVMDITQNKILEKWATSLFSKNYIPDILINNAGIGLFGKIDELPDTEWLNMMNTNLNGMYFITRAIVPFMKQSDSHKHIINIGSIMGTMGKEEATAYSTTKFGVQGFSQSLFHELRDHSIKVTCINPGSIETDFFNRTGISTHSNMLQAADVADTIIHVLETPDNLLINEMMLRPLNPRKPDNKNSL
ncbi:MAG: SDR family oxidoreductase [Chitinophagaceae bacterium]|nr:MAG: SDR family oxidoreductase [Chitinophagaceae bacterium]